MNRASLMRSAHFFFTEISLSPDRSTVLRGDGGDHHHHLFLSTRLPL